jgi:hypothetical protein
VTSEPASLDAPSPPVRLYPRLLGPAWPALDAKLRQFLGVYGAWQGRFDIRRGTTLFARLLGAIARLPASGVTVPTLLEVSPDRGGERWFRRFGSRRLMTFQRTVPPDLLAERLACLEIQLRVTIVGGTIYFEQVGAAVAIGPLRLPLPRWLSPRLTARTRLAERGDAIGVRVNMTGPGESLWIEYEGTIECRPPLP